MPAADWLEAGDTPATTPESIGTSTCIFRSARASARTALFTRSAPMLRRHNVFAKRFCASVDQAQAQFPLQPQTIFFGGGTPTALTSAQLEFLVRRFW